MGTIFYLGIVFFFIALIAWLVGARGLAGMSANMGMTLMWIFLVIAIILVIVGIFNGRATV